MFHFTHNTYKNYFWALNDLVFFYVIYPITYYPYEPIDFLFLFLFFASLELKLPLNRVDQLSI
jgi:hypothetical protein